MCVRLTGARDTLYPPGHLPERISTGRRNTPLGRLACLPEQVYSFNAPGHKSLSHYYCVFSESPFAHANLRNCNAFSHQTSHTCRPSPLIVHLIFFEPIQIHILDLEANPCFQIFLNISKTYNQIFSCNISKRRSGQELPFIFFELRAPTCL